MTREVDVVVIEGKCEAVVAHCGGRDDLHLTAGR